MTVLIGDVKDIGWKPTDGTITIFSTATRRANATTGIVTRERREVPLVAGRFRTGALDPGRTTVELVAPGVFESWTFDLPTDGTVSLADMIENSEEYRPSSAVVNAAQAAAAQAELSAQRASGFESGAERARDEAVAAQASVQRVVDGSLALVRGEFTDLTDRAESAASRAEEARDAASGSSGDAASSAVSAKEDADRAEAAAGKAATTAADQTRAELAGFAQAASLSEQNAAGSASAAQGFAERAGVAQSGVATVAGRVEADRVRAESAAQGAEASESAAAGSAESARNAADAAGGARAGAEQARDAALQAAESAQVGAPEGGWPRESLSQGVRESLTRADSALTTVPRATSQVAGGVQLAGDLAGTWDAPTVPGLADKLNSNQVSTSAMPSSIVRRSRESTVKTDAPTQADDATPKAYVDDAVGGVQSQLDALAARVQALESSAVTSTTYRKIAKGTGSRSDTIYIQE
ncbi:hypothetical protein [Corynebacterium amycolatum]|uniref:hypothetical protein n=1 Tax=Corynebacterium amycolatum TaxID=43765 RepID=UPI00234C6A1E|nr:hypothetical protein [Corynebacterium amycolatum]MDC7116167.1 hypothetical protein [Corynebacterium amycolatum]